MKLEIQRVWRLSVSCGCCKVVNKGFMVTIYLRAIGFMTRSDDGQKLFDISSWLRGQISRMWKYTADHKLERFSSYQSSVLKLTMILSQMTHISLRYWLIWKCVRNVLHMRQSLCDYQDDKWDKVKNLCIIYGNAISTVVLLSIVQSREPAYIQLYIHVFMHSILNMKLC